MFENLSSTLEDQKLVPTQEFVETPKQAPAPQMGDGEKKPRPEYYPQMVSVPKENGASTYYIYLCGPIDNVGNVVVLLDTLPEQFDVVVVLAMPNISTDNATVLANALHNTRANTTCHLISAGSLVQAVIAFECKKVLVTELSTIWMQLIKTPNGGSSADQKDRLEDDIKFESGIMEFLIQKQLITAEEAKLIWDRQKIRVLHGEDLVNRVANSQKPASAD